MEISLEEYKENLVNMHIKGKRHFRRIIFRAMWEYIYFHYVRLNPGVRFNENRVYYQSRYFYKKWFYDTFIYYINYNIWHNKRINVTYKEEE